MQAVAVSLRGFVVISVTLELLLSEGTSLQVSCLQSGGERGREARLEQLEMQLLHLLRGKPTFFELLQGFWLPFRLSSRSLPVIRRRQHR